MDWSAEKQEQQRTQAEERKYLIGLTEVEANSLSAPQWYQRMRYLREIEAAEYQEKCRRQLPVGEATKRAAKRTKFIYIRD